MVTNFEELVSLCDEEIRHREYCPSHYGQITKNWNKLRLWMDNQDLTEFNEQIGYKYCVMKNLEHI